MRANNGTTMPNTPLPTIRYPAGTRIVQVQPPQQAAVTFESPAINVMTDLAQVRAATIPPQSPLSQAELKMIHQGVRLLFVVSEMPSVDGIVTAGDLSGDKPLRLVHQQQLKFSDMTVSDVMTPLNDIDAIDIVALRRANVGQVVATLLKSGRPHLLVTEQVVGAPLIRGLISRTQIERQLGTQLMANEIATTFAEIEQALSH